MESQLVISVRGEARLEATRNGRCLGVTGVDGQLEGGPRTVHITLLLEQDPEVDRRRGGLVGLAGVDDLLEGGPRALHSALLA